MYKIRVTDQRGGTDNTLSTNEHTHTTSSLESIRPKIIIIPYTNAAFLFWQVSFGSVERMGKEVQTENVNLLSLSLSSIQHTLQEFTRVRYLSVICRRNFAFGGRSTACIHCADIELIDQLKG